MEPRLFSLLEPAPPGFIHRPQLATRDVRRAAFALYAATVESAETALQPWAGKIAGLLITPGPALELTHRPSGLYHLTVNARTMAQLGDWAPHLLALLEGESAQAERSRGLVMEAARLANERSQAAAEFASFRTSLLAENQERRRIEQELRASEVRFRTIYNSVSDCIFIHHAQTGKILDANQRACELLGYTSTEIRRLSLGDLIAPGGEFTQERALHVIQSASPTPQTMTWQARSKSGRLIWMEVHLRSAFILGVESVLVTARDITERRQAQEDQQRMEAKLLQTQKLESLGVLAGGIAHDFNNLLLVILGNVDMASLDVAPASPARTYLKEVDHAARRAADLCRQMLAYAGKAHFQVQSIFLNDLIRDMDHLLKASVSKKAELVYELAENMPALHADPTQLRQIIMNLVINASEAQGDQEGRIRVLTGVQFCDRAFLEGTVLGPGLPEGNYAYLEVSDAGCGMDADTLTKVFDPFFSTKFTGRGLGLATVYGITRSHQGAIKLESQVGGGTTFRVLLPALQPATQTPEIPAAAPANLGSWRGQGTVLVVEDEDAIRTFTQAVLNRMGFRTLMAENGRRALDLFQAHQFANHLSEQDRIVCVLLDLTMPHMGGDEAYRALRAMQRDLRIIVTSGHSEQDVAPRFASKPFTSFLLKPYRPDDLRAALYAILKNA
jgi:two-component system cell cycle sensor histidine kinase/response regulator CckA